ncbi:apolipoprotein N-acyltransferase [Tamaricihabitans halophyticus]|uniref:Apolipoprotein N-acyltransferase n=1 Tax=Tamaricihabitans halophyticus TaxID=1262583 RepID=A0A4R2QV22_9PSEU|nr:apolipoprotein N-acyltransferase [Tamaricihabitans halophyticus]
MLIRSAIALVSGAVLYLAFPPRTLWWLAPIAFLGLCAVIWGRKARAGFGYGLVFASVWQLLLLKWLDDFLSVRFGIGPWLALSLICALLIAVAVAAMAAVSKLPLAPLWMAMIFVAGEALRARFPLNGFPWSELAYSQADGVLLPLVSIGGTALLGFTVVLLGAAAAALVWRGRPRPGIRPRRSDIPAGIMLITPLLAGGLLLPSLNAGATDGGLRVAVVQGNAPNVGIDLLAEGDTIWANHQAGLERLLRDIRTGAQPQPDLVLLPESSARLHPGGNTAAQLADYADRLGAPLLSGALAYGADGSVRNTVVAVEPGAGQVASYAKQELVPFSEYIPFRNIAGWFTPFLDRDTDMTPGTEPGLVRTAGTELGLAICYEIAYDAIPAEAVEAGAKLLLVPTNNAWFGDTEMSYQQLAMSRVRAVEHDRAVINAATSGVSAFVRPDGSVASQTELYTATTLAADVPLRSQVTLSDRLGKAPELALTGGGLLALGGVLGGWLRTRWHARRTSDQHDRGQDDESNTGTRSARRRGGQE